MDLDEWIWLFQRDFPTERENGIPTPTFPPREPQICLNELLIRSPTPPLSPCPAIGRNSFGIEEFWDEKSPGGVFDVPRLLPGGFAAPRSLLFGFSLSLGFIPSLAGFIQNKGGEGAEGVFLGCLVSPIPGRMSLGRGRSLGFLGQQSGSRWIPAGF